MKKHKRSGFTVVELIVVIVVIGILAGIVTIAYRETQKNARDEKRRVDATMLRSAVENYYTDNGAYPMPGCTTGPGGSAECWNNETWQLLKEKGYLKNIPQPNTKSPSASYNTASDGNANYGYYSDIGTSFAIYVPMENVQPNGASNATACKTGKSVVESLWGGINFTPMCTF